MLYTPGIAVGQMSGSLGGIVASHNRFGSYFRGRTVPVNPSSSAQQAVRNIFATLTNAWINILTSAQRAAWDTYASQINWKNKLGNDIKLTGFNHFMRSNTVSQRPGFPRVDDGPTIFSLAVEDPTFVVTASEATQVVSVVFDDGLDWADEDEAGMQVLMSEPVAPSRQFIPPVYQYGDTFEGDNTTPITSPQTFAAPFPIAADQLIQCEARILRADGRLSGPFQGIATVAS